ncbi:hypothetical protein CRUP_028481 [Coryphaenoides rupestris]|nr:hypothetical protein CRUP_028481 [Coryphaenoides rupestris]
MAVKLFYWFLLWKLCFCLKDVRCFCNVACTTNYSEHLECACSGISPPSSVELEVHCCNDDETEVREKCWVHPPGSGCHMYIKDLDVSVDTKCTARVRDQDGSPAWLLGDIVKAMPPFNVSATHGAGGVNITWNVKLYPHMRSMRLRYRVRLRDPTEVRIFNETNQYFFVDYSWLRPNTRYQADIQACFLFFQPLHQKYGGNFKDWVHPVFSEAEVLMAAGGGIGGGAAGTSERFPRLTPRRVWLEGRMCGWTEPWDDDYPRVDLDTVDSGFGESDCSSPVCADLPSEEEPQGSAPLFGQEGGVKSNYVRQWMKTHQHPAPPPSPTIHPEGQ